MSQVLAGIALLATACSTLPPDEFPPFTEHDVVLRYTAPADGRLPMPSSGDEVALQLLEATPAPREERFDDQGRRWFAYAPGQSVQVHTRCRIYGTAARAPRALGDVFPGASIVGGAP